MTVTNESVFTIVHNITPRPVIVYADWVKIAAIPPYELLRFDGIDLTSRHVSVKVGSDDDFIGPNGIIETVLFFKCVSKVCESDHHLHKSKVL